jgi:hypothetical protein
MILRGSEDRLVMGITGKRARSGPTHARLRHQDRQRRDLTRRQRRSPV